MRQNNDKNTKEKSVRVLGITGGVGAGKSTVLTYLKEQYGAYILEADRIGHLLQQPGQEGWKRIIDTFGREILNDDQTIDRGRLGTIVYADREKLETLNAIIHPAVRTYIEAQIRRMREPVLLKTDPNRADGSAASEKKGVSLIVIEAALLLEAHYDEICDEVWYIYADEQTRAARLIKSRGYTLEKVRQIMKNQMSEAEFRHRCPVVIDNSGKDLCAVFAQIDRLLESRETGGVR